MSTCYTFCYELYSVGHGVAEKNGELTDGTFLMGDGYYGALVILPLNHVMHDVMWSHVSDADIAL